MKTFYILTLAASLTLPFGWSLASCKGSGPCPASIPAQGSACTFTMGHLLTCEYGGDADGQCTTTATCFQTGWQVFAPAAGCGEQPAGCPASFGAVPVGQACSLGSGVCEYPEGLCACEYCAAKDGGQGEIWHCAAWPPAPCAPPRPLLGEACSDEGATCFFGSCCAPPQLGPDMICQGGVWTAQLDPACSCAFPVCP